MKTLENNSWVAPLLQVSDPLFPTGGYAHSLGFEQWAYANGYDSKEDIKQFFLNQWQTERVFCTAILMSRENIDWFRIHFSRAES